MADPRAALAQYAASLAPNLPDAVKYNVNQVGPTEWQAIVELNLLEGQPEFAGEICGSVEDAERAAATQAMAEHGSTLAELQESVNAQAGQAPDQADMSGGSSFGVGEKRQRDENGWEQGGAQESMQMQVAADQGDGGQAPEGGDDEGEVAPGERNEKVRLNTLLMRIIKKALVKGDTFYELAMTPEGTFQATVTCNCLPGEWQGAVWAGEVSPTKHGAEQAAAAMAISQIEVEPELAKMARGSGKSKGGKGKDGCKGKGGDMGGPLGAPMGGMPGGCCGSPDGGKGWGWEGGKGDGGMGGGCMGGGFDGKGGGKKGGFDGGMDMWGGMGGGMDMGGMSLVPMGVGMGGMGGGMDMGGGCMGGGMGGMGGMGGGWDGGKGGKGGKGGGGKAMGGMMPMMMPMWGDGGGW
eukprot:TRINITY_DN215_c1_g1_i1.p1 TRINITY_DN215_c1_g1~~TRINITY_DN215_c1_g1_i1.p1  ORF type:complete len:409 (-),score=147.18 TRINITY_DN215_c1_g1_i1:119-1345(-)